MDSLSTAQQGDMAALVETAAHEFHRCGVVVLPSLLGVEQARCLRELVEQRYRSLDPDQAVDLDLTRGGVSLMRMFEYHQAFRDLLELEPAISLVERLLGTDCHVVAQNALRTPKGKGIVNWHVDDALFFPFLADMPPLGDDTLLPCFSLNVMVVLSDVEADAFGPTQVVAGSHRWGRKPEYTPSLPAGTTSASLTARAGDVYLVNSQTWHRGAQNESDRVRCLLTTTYGRRFISQRFYPFLNYRMPDHVLDGASERLLRLLGKHGKGPYG
jgi:ectoine hydroxylase-related dioxygenase (phytanoyl-CoA dioxygenase family)